MSARTVEARRLLREAQIESPGKPLYKTEADTIAAAQVLATLELAEQQRLGNLIALGKRQNADGSRVAQYAVTEPDSTHTLKVRDEITKGLGL